MNRLKTQKCRHNCIYVSDKLAELHGAVSALNRYVRNLVPQQHGAGGGVPISVTSRLMGNGSVSFSIQAGLVLNEYRTKTVTVSALAQDRAYALQRALNILFQQSQALDQGELIERKELMEKAEPAKHEFLNTTSAWSVITITHQETGSELKLNKGRLWRYNIVSIKNNLEAQPFWLATAYVQSFLQLEGNDAFAYVLKVVPAVNMQTHWCMCSNNNRIVAEGWLKTPEHKDDPGQIAITNISFATECGYKEMTFIDMINMGTTAASSLIRS